MSPVQEAESNAARARFRSQIAHPTSRNATEEKACHGGVGQLRNEPQFFAGCVLQQSDLPDKTGPCVNSFPSPQASQRAPIQVAFPFWALNLLHPRKKGENVLTESQGGGDGVVLTSLD